MSSLDPFSGTLPEYQIDEVIYESANSTVYRGRRSKDNQPVILKALKEDYPDPAEIVRYQNEFELLHDLDLDGVITAWDIVQHQNRPIIILEDFGAESLIQMLTKRRLSIREFLPLAIRIADGLGRMHAAGVIHKNINPDNIVLNPETGQSIIIDFGIASRLPRENQTVSDPEQLEGTLAYMSPEQTGRINTSIDHRADLYSLGITLYEMLTGRLPFTATDALELVHCHLAKTPPPASEVSPEIPPILSDIVMKLMAKSAENRYQSALGLKADLEKCQVVSDDLRILGELRFELGQDDYSERLQIPRKLYGRDQELNALLKAFERVAQGSAELMLVSGYSGVGKSVLVQEIQQPAMEKGAYYVAGKFDQFQKDTPYHAITQAFNEFCRYLLIESTEALAAWKSKILDALGRNGVQRMGSTSGSVRTAQELRIRGMP